MDDGHLREVPVVRRVPSGSAEVLRRLSKILDAETFEPALDRARRAGEDRELQFAASAPLRRLIEQDEISLGAQRRLAQVRKEMIVSPEAGVLSKTGGGPFESWSLDLKPGLHVFGPPYDLDRPGPTDGSPAEASANRDAGEFSVDTPYNPEAHGFRVASASIVVVFEVSKVGTLSVRPVTQFTFSWLVAGLHLSAHTEGRLFITAIRDDDGKVMDSRGIGVWSRTTESDVHSESGGETALASEFQVNFLAEPGRSSRSEPPSRAISPATSRSWPSHRGACSAGRSRGGCPSLLPSYDPESRLSGRGVSLA